MSTTFEVYPSTESVPTFQQLLCLQVPLSFPEIDSHPSSTIALKSMTDKTLWIAGPALFSVIGMLAGYLNNANYTALGTFAGFAVGLGVTCFALAGEKPKR